jgi:hypothetical protein
MGQVQVLPPGEPSTEEADDAWAQSLREVMREVLATLPDHTTLGELVGAAKADPRLAPVLDFFTVGELIETARKRPKSLPATNGRNGKPRGEVVYDEEGNPLIDLDLGPQVIRRRADVPDGDIRVLRCLAERGALRESDLANMTTLTGEQLRIILRALRTKGFVLVEGSGLKRRFKITRHGNGYLRKQG